MMRHAQTWFRRAALALVLSTVAAACGGGEDREGGEEGAKGGVARDRNAVQRGGTAVLSELSDMSKPLPFLYEGNVDTDLGDILYMPLLRTEWRDGRAVYLTSHDNPMAIAWHWEYAGPDSSAIRYRMRSALKWSDGQPLTAHDVVWTYRMTADPKVASPQQSYAEHLDSVAAENDSTVVFHFKRRYPEMLFHSGLPIAPKHAYEGSDPAQIRSHRRLLTPDNGALVVSGPFMVGSWRKGQQISFIPNPHFPVRPNLDQIVIRIIPEATTRLVELQRGALDFTRPIPHDQIPNLRSQPGIRFERERQRSYDYIAYNPRAMDAFADPEVRRALSLAIDTRGLIRGLQMQDFAAPAGGPYAPIFKDLYDPQRTPPLPYDTLQAKRILEAKGWRDSDGDGIREKDGKPFRFTLLTNAGNVRKADVQQIVQQQLKRVGVDVRLQQLEFNTFQERQMGKEYEALLGTWIVGLSADITPLWAEGSPLNIVSYKNPRVSQLFEQALTQPNDQAAAPYWRAAAEQIARDQPYTFLYYFDQVDGVRDRLQGMKIDTYGAYQNAWQWWVRSEQPGGAAAPPPADTAAR